MSKPKVRFSLDVLNRKNYFEDPDDDVIDIGIDQGDRCRSTLQMGIELEKIEDVKNRTG